MPEVEPTVLKVAVGPEAVPFETACAELPIRPDVPAPFAATAACEPAPAAWACVVLPEVAVWPTFVVELCVWILAATFAPDALAAPLESAAVDFGELAAELAAFEVLKAWAPLA